MGTGRGPFSEAVQMCNPRVYVVDDDLRGFAGDIANRHAAELGQWRMADELSHTACAILAFLTFFRGLRGNGRDGCGVQLSLVEWSRCIGRSRRMVQYAFRELEHRGFIFRRRRFAKLKDPWTDERGRTHTEADIRYAVYLTQFGARRIERRGETRVEKVIAGSRRLTLTVCGLVESLLTELREILKAIAPRVTDAADHCTPSSEAGRSPVSDEACGALPSGSPTFSRGRAPQDRVDKLRDRPHDARKRAKGFAGTEGLSDGPRLRGANWVLEEAEACWREGRTTAALWQPERWAKAGAEERKHLVQSFAPIALELAKFITAAAARRRGEIELYEREAF